MTDALDQRLAAADPDRRMAALFAPAKTRARLNALYAFNDEIARVRDKVSEPMLGDLRLAWWREAVDEIYDPAKQVRAHEAAVALDGALKDARPPRLWLDRLVSSRGRDLDADPFNTMLGLRDYAEQSSATLMRLAVWLTAPDAELSEKAEAAITHAGVAWALTGLMRAYGAHRAKGRIIVPREALEARDLSADELKRTEDADAARHAMRPVLEAATREYAEARARYSALPIEAAPALIYAALIPHYLKKMARADYNPFVEQADLGRLKRQSTLFLASLRGRI